MWFCSITSDSSNSTFSGHVLAEKFSFVDKYFQTRSFRAYTVALEDQCSYLHCPWVIVIFMAIFLHVGIIGAKLY